MAFLHKLLWLVISVKILLVSFPGTSAADSAWNGQTTPGSTVLSQFTSFYVPPGTKSYDSNSPMILYSGNWRIYFSAGYIQNSVHSTSEPGAACQFSFTGTGIEYFGNKNNKHGLMNIFIDGVLVDTVDAWSNYTMPRRQQRIFTKKDLPYGRHTLKIVNLPKPKVTGGANVMDVDAFVVTEGTDPGLTLPAGPKDVDRHSLLLSHQSGSEQESWSIEQKGTTGVHAMQLAVISPTHALIVDKVEHNPLTISGRPAWAALYNMETDIPEPLHMESNSFCAGSAFLSNGTLINVGGNPVVGNHTSSADFGDVDGTQAVRLFEPCNPSSAKGCQMYENHARIRMASPRWYNTVVRISDGSAMIVGGAKKGGWINNATVNNPTIEYFPPKNIHESQGLPIKLPFLVDTLHSNLFPIVFALPDGLIFMAANNDAMIYNPTTNAERRLPAIPNGVRVTYPMAGTGVLLPLSYVNDYAPEVLLCGGSTVDDKKPSYEISSQDPASAQCARMILTEEGIAAGWRTESMPQARTMPDAVLLPTGDVVIVNGASTGISGYGNVLNQVGSSNADHPVFTPVLYNPRAPLGQRFSSNGIPSSNIARLYHSVATLTPSGAIMIAGSNPNLDRSEIEYGTEYRVEWLKPPYMKMARPKIDKGPTQIEFRSTFQLHMTLISGDKVEVALMDFGTVTHAVHANSRMVYLQIERTGNILNCNAPPKEAIYPPGPGWLFVIVNGIPSKGLHVMVGDGRGPPVSEEALKNLLQNTSVDQRD